MKLTTNGTGNATVVNDAGLNFAASTVGGALNATATTGNISDSGNLTVTGTSMFLTGASGSNIILDSSGNAFSNAVTLQADAGNETFGNITFVDSGAVRLHSSAGANGDLYINAATDAAVGGNLNVTATTGNITQGRAVTVGGTSSFTTSANNADITLNTTTNAFTGAITLSTTGSSAHANIDGGTTALNIGASSVAGNLYLRTGNNITDSGTVTVGYGLVATTDKNNGAINLGTLAVGSTVDLTTHGSGNATVVNDAVLIIAASEVGGNLAATATTGNILDNGVLTVAGTSSFTTSQNNADITLNNANAFTGAVSLNTTGSSAHATVVDASGLNLAASTVGGNLSATAITGNISDSGNLAVTGTSSFTTSATDGTITLNNANAFTGAVALNTTGSSAHATVVDASGLNLAASTVGGNLSATATTGNMTDSGVLTIAGTSSFTTSATDADIILNNANAFTGAVALNTTGSSGNATVVDASGLNLGASTVGGNLSATATTGNMEDSGVLTIAGTSSFTTSANNATITLNNANAFTNAVALNTTGSTGHGDGGRCIRLESWYLDRGR